MPSYSNWGFDAVAKYHSPQDSLPGLPTTLVGILHHTVTGSFRMCQRAVDWAWLLGGWAWLFRLLTIVDKLHCFIPIRADREPYWAETVILSGKREKLLVQSETQALLSGPLGPQSSYCYPLNGNWLKPA